MTAVYSTREEWLHAAREHLDAMFTDMSVTPNDVRLSVGFPKGRGIKATTIGVCHYNAADSVPQIFIHPAITDPVNVVAILAHELAHAYLPVGTGHKGSFVTTVTGLGLIGKPTATVPGPDFTVDANEMLSVLGDYPHAELLSEGKPQGTRMIKCECDTCGVKFRLSQKWVDIAEMDRGLRCPLGCESEATDTTMTVG